MNDDENINFSNSFSDDEKIELKQIKERMDKTENQINEIAEQIQNLADSVNIIQQKMDNTPKEIPNNNEVDKIDFNIHTQEKQQDKNEIISSSKETIATSGKKKAKRYKEDIKENIKEEKREKRKEYKNEPRIETKIEYKKETKTENTKKSKLGIIGEFAFYILLIVIVLGAFLLRSNSGGQPTSFAGYSLFTVLTSSMESEIPKGSLVITKNVDPKTLQIGDDITFMAGKTTTITHRIIAIMESYQNTGERAFQTQGVMNEEPDKNLVPAVNVIGKVVWHSKVLGDIANFLGQNLIFLFFVVVVLIVFVNVMKNVFKNDESKQSEEQTTEQKEEKAHKRRIRGKGKREK